MADINDPTTPAEAERMRELRKVPEVQMPTVGRLVHLSRKGSNPGNPVAAIVVNPTLDSSEPDSRFATGIKVFALFEDGAHMATVVHMIDVEHDGSFGWEWMPYQKGQAKKLEEVQAIEFPGLRRGMSDDELNNRFTYHAPSAYQVEQYAEIRSEARAFARTLLAHCPPCAELASALDHLDTVVFKANAAIARHGSGGVES